MQKCWKHISKRWTPNGDKGQNIEHWTWNMSCTFWTILYRCGFNSLILMSLYLLYAIVIVSGRRWTTIKNDKRKEKCNKSWIKKHLKQTLKLKQVKLSWRTKNHSSPVNTCIQDTIFNCRYRDENEKWLMFISCCKSIPTIGSHIEQTISM